MVCSAGWCWLWQTSQEQVDEVLSQTVRIVIDSLKQGTYGPATQEQIAEAQAGQLVPILEARFVTSQDADVKARLSFRNLLTLMSRRNSVPFPSSHLR